MSFIQNIFSFKQKYKLKKLSHDIQKIKTIGNDLKNKKTIDLKSRILYLKEHITTLILKKNDPNNLTYISTLLSGILHEVYAIVREISKRTLNMKHFDVQLIGGIILNEGKIAEMKTGEGKTLAATLPAILNSLTSKSVHIITVNDYLASRDAEWMGKIYKALGLKTSVLKANQSNDLKKKSYLADITYGANSNFGFDYLKDNMKYSFSECTQRNFFYTIVDEIDSILIDEARTPLIISGESHDGLIKYKQINEISLTLKKSIDFNIDEKSKSIYFTDTGISKCEKKLFIKNLYDSSSTELLHLMNQSIRAHHLFKKDVDYIIHNQKIVIIDEHTGRLMHGRRWSDGLHHAIESKEHVPVRPKYSTLASITFQNLFRMYPKLSGMTGTAETEAEEFLKIYNLEVVKIPTNKKLRRIDQVDQIYKTTKAKMKALLKDVIFHYRKRQPLLIGTSSIISSEYLSKNLTYMKIPHYILNANQSEQEAKIVAQVGKLGSICIATSIAGRGTDILLGGDPIFIAKNKITDNYKYRYNNKQFTFFTGKPNLINYNKLAKIDSVNLKYLISFKYQLNNKRHIYNLNKIKLNIYNFLFFIRKKQYELFVQNYKTELIHSIYKSSYEAKNVIKKGGLRIIVTERNESRRIDNQLKGRTGRQGNPGSTCFYLSLNDNLLRIFGSEKLINIINYISEPSIPLSHPWLSQSIAKAQKNIESFHFESRKNLIDYDDILNQQRQAIYSLRKTILINADIKAVIFDLIKKIIISLIEKTNKFSSKKKNTDSVNYSLLEKNLFNIFNTNILITPMHYNENKLLFFIYEKIIKYYNLKEEIHSSNILRFTEKSIYLKSIDNLWKNHLNDMERLKNGIDFRAYAQNNPQYAYQKDGFHLFKKMNYNIKISTLTKLFKL